MYCLEVVTKVPEGGQSFYSVCVRQPYSVGRAEGCDIRFNSPDVSRQHATVQVVLSSNVEYAYARGGASPYRGATGGSPPSPSGNNSASGHGDGPSVAPHLALVVTNASKFGVTVDGTLVTGSATVPHGGMVTIGSVGMRCTYRPMCLSIANDCYGEDHRAELVDMATQLGAEVFDDVTTEKFVLERYASAAEAWSARGSMAGTPQASTLAELTAFPTTRDEASFNSTLRSVPVTPTSQAESKSAQQQQQGSGFPAVRPIGRFHATEVIDNTPMCVAALMNSYSIVLPSYIFELFAALADNCSKPLHALPKPCDFEPPKSREVFGGVTYCRPEPRTVPFSLFPHQGQKERSRTALLNNRMFVVRNGAMCDVLGPIITAAGGVLVPWAGAMDITAYEEHGDDDPTELPRDEDDPFFYEEVGLPPKPAPRDRDAAFRQRRAMLARFTDRRYAIATEHEIALLKDPTVEFPSPMSEPREHDTQERDASLRHDWIFMARNGWVVVAASCILKALLSNKFVPLPELPPEREAYNATETLNSPTNKQPSFHRLHSSIIDDAHHHHEDSGDDDGIGGEGAALDAAHANRQGVAADVDSDATPSELGSEYHLLPDGTATLARDSPTRRPRALSPTKLSGKKSKDPIENWVATSAAATREQMLLDMKIHRLQTVVDRTITVCKTRVDEIARNLRARRAELQPATVGFLRNVVNKCSAHLAQIEDIAASDDAAGQKLALQQQWDMCVAVRNAATEALDAAETDGPDGDAAHAARGRATHATFRGTVTAADSHMIAARPRTPQRAQSPGATIASRPQRGRSPVRGPAVPSPALLHRRTASSNSISTTSQRSLAGSVHLTDASRNQHHHATTPQRAQSPNMSLAMRRRYEGVSASTQSHNVVAPAEVKHSGLRDRTRWARYYPPAPVQAHAPPAAANQDALNESRKQKAHHALLVHIPPANLPDIAKHRRLFISKYRREEGDVRFNMWLQSQSPQWTAAFHKALEGNDMTFGDFIRTSA